VVREHQVAVRDGDLATRAERQGRPKLVTYSGSAPVKT
jgi:hypothetical protein